MAELSDDEARQIVGVFGDLLSDRLRRRIETMVDDPF